MTSDIPSPSPIPTSTPTSIPIPKTIITHYTPSSLSVPPSPHPSPSPSPSSTPVEYHPKYFPFSFFGPSQLPPPPASPPYSSQMMKSPSQMITLASPSPSLPSLLMTLSSPTPSSSSLMSSSLSIPSPTQLPSSSPKFTPMDTSVSIPLPSLSSSPLSPSLNISSSLSSHSVSLPPTPPPSQSRSPSLFPHPSPSPPILPLSSPLSLASSSPLSIPLPPPPSLSDSHSLPCPSPSPSPVLSPPLIPTSLVVDLSKNENKINLNGENENENEDGNDDVHDNDSVSSSSTSPSSPSCYLSSNDVSRVVQLKFEWQMSQQQVKMLSETLDNMRREKDNYVKMFDKLKGEKGKILLLCEKERDEMREKYLSELSISHEWKTKYDEKCHSLLTFLTQQESNYQQIKRLEERITMEMKIKEGMERRIEEMEERLDERMTQLTTQDEITHVTPSVLLATAHYRLQVENSIQQQIIKRLETQNQNEILFHKKMAKEVTKLRGKMDKMEKYMDMMTRKEVEEGEENGQNGKGHEEEKHLAPSLSHRADCVSLQMELLNAKSLIRSLRMENKKFQRNFYGKAMGYFAVMGMVIAVVSIMEKLYRG